MRFHFTREALENGTIQLTYCPTNDMTADVMTKALPRVKLGRFTAMIGLQRRQRSA